jgi:hypothetical protein
VRLRDAWDKLPVLAGGGGGEEVIAFADFYKWWHADGMTCASRC